MEAQCENRFILVSRKTRLQELVERFNTWPQAKFYLEHNQVDAQDYLQEHDHYTKCLNEAEQILKSLGRFQLLERTLLPSYRFAEQDILIVIGQDGLVANTLKYLSGQPVIAVNPDPLRWDGKLLPFEMNQLREIVVRTIQKKTDRKSVTFAEAVTNDGQKMLAVNDLFIGPKSHTSAGYRLSWKSKTETQSSSGIIVSTGLGSTGWFQSILAGAMGITGNKKHLLSKGFAWSDNFLQFAVREPFPSNVTGIDLVFGQVSDHQPMHIESMMPGNGVIFSDGIEEDFLSFNSGTKVTINVAKVRGQLIV